MKFLLPSSSEYLIFPPPLLRAQKLKYVTQNDYRGDVSLQAKTD
jgi:hypothetical protein